MAQYLNMKRYLPLSVESVLRRHSVAHDSIQESFALSSIEPQDLKFKKKKKVKRHDHKKLANHEKMKARAFSVNYNSNKTLHDLAKLFSVALKTPRQLWSFNATVF
jgi:hypothetical protein